MKKVLIQGFVDFVIGQLRYGHYEGVLELSDEEYQEFKNNPLAFYKEHKDWLTELDFLVDDYRIYDIGNITDISFEEL